MALVVKLRLFLGLMFAQLSTACMAHESDSLQQRVEKARAQAIEYVDALPGECMYTDGYECAEDAPAVGESSMAFQKAIDQHGTVSPMFLEAWPVAYEAFKEHKDLSEEQKQLKHYRIGFHYADQITTIWFRPLLLPQMDNGEVVGKMRAVIGQDIRIGVDMKTNEVNKVVVGR